MAVKYFDIPYYKRLTSQNGWEQKDSLGTHYHVARAFFRLNIYQQPGPCKIGKKFEVSGHAHGMTTERVKIVEMETDIFNEIKSIEESIIETECILKVLSELTTVFGKGNILTKGGKVRSDFNLKTKHIFKNDFHITKTIRTRKCVRYEFKDTLPADFDDRVCGVEAYQECRADLYLILIDFLNIKYERKMFGLRKKIRKYPFPINRNGTHPNIIKIGAPIASFKFYQLLPNSSLIIKDSEYRPEVTDDAMLEIIPCDSKLKDRPYWGVPRHPSLYQLARVAFPKKWINTKHQNFTKEELMEIELGEAEESAWWFLHGPGRKLKA